MIKARWFLRSLGRCEEVVKFKVIQIKFIMANGSLPPDLIKEMLQSLFGEGYSIALGIGLLALLIGYMFLSYRFVIRGRNDPKWINIKQVDKLVISFFMGFIFLVVGSETSLIFFLVLKAINGLEAFRSSGYNSLHILFVSIFFYAFVMIYNKKFKNKFNLYKQIEKYFIYLFELFFILFAVISLSTLTIIGFIGFFVFILFTYFTFHKPKR